MTGNSEKDQLKFNLGLGYVMRIDYIIARVMESRELRDAQAWYLHLQSLYLELKAKIDKDMQADAKKLMNNLTQSYNDWCDTPQRYKSQVIGKVYASAEALEDFLRGIMHDLGLLTPTRDGSLANFG